MKAILIIALILISCSKEDNNGAKCYTCTFSGYGQVIVKDTCADDVTGIRYYDSMGRAYSSTCEQK